MKYPNEQQLAEFSAVFHAALNKGKYTVAEQAPSAPTVNPLYDPTQGMGLGEFKPSRGPEADFMELLEKIADRPALTGRPTGINRFIR